MVVVVVASWCGLVEVKCICATAGTLNMNHISGVPCSHHGTPPLRCNAMLPS